MDPKWLLSHAELSRVRWRKGSHDGELIVEVECAEVPSPDVVVEIGYGRDTPVQGTESVLLHSLPRVYTTVVGQYRGDETSHSSMY